MWRFTSDKSECYIKSMKYVNNITRWISSQEHLFFVFALLLIIPNYVLFFTEPLPATVGIASVLLPLSFTMGLLLLGKKPGIVVWCLFPKIILDAGQLVLLSLFGESVVAVDMFLNLTSSNASEAGELLGNIFLVIIGCALIYVPVLWLACRSARMNNKLSFSFRKKWAVISLLLFILSGSLFGLAKMLDNYSLKNDIYPANALYNLYFAIRKADRNANYKITSADFTFEAKKLKHPEGKREIYVLVVGETSRAMQWSLYGYDRETTPRMEKLDGLVYFKDAITQSNNTHKSVPVILSAASAEDYGVIYNVKSIVTAFKEAGFKTLVVANQKLTLSMIGAFYREADTFIDTSDENKGGYLSSLPDEVVLPHVKDIIKNSEDNLFIVLHTYGSHFNYRERYPKEFSVYKPDKAEGIRASHVKELRNAYDNSILYTDHILGELTDILKESNACSSMLYLSDHGEDVFDDARARYLHASPIPTYYQLHIPYIIWFSENYRATFPEKYEAAVSHNDFPVSTNSVFHTMLDIADVNTAYADVTLSLTSNTFVKRNRMYLGDHDDPVPFYKIGLKKLDFLMLDKWNIDYIKDE